MATNSTTLKSSVLAVRSGLTALAATQDDAQRRYIADLLCRESTTLAEQCLKRNVWLNDAYDWIEAHEDELDAESLKAREDRWLLNLRQYETAMDLLGQVLETLNATPKPTRPAVSSGAALPTQEAFL